ncbi:unnamed protein product [Candidula unifasciata]|uniref:Outer dense fiber protein 3 n=1 Tax=Candidula unifasciata TaxID=100452 RepID=A0A8S3ZIK3_9EUPU|nr:unnamed protein product [Candidula unifasciata]
MATQFQTKDIGGYAYTRPRGPIAAQYNSPGPCYMLPTLVGQPKHDFRSVHPKKPAWDDCSPGPCYLPQDKYYRTGPDGAPRFSLYGRPRDLTTYKTPGPGAYKPESAGNLYGPSPPKFSFGARHQYRKTDDIPGPNQYTLPNMTGKTVESHKKSSPNFTLVGRSKQGGFDEDLSRTPGPGAYKVTPTTIYKNAPPQISISSRNPMPGDNTQKPGPGAHSPENLYLTRQSAHGFTFGFRHSPYKATCMDSRIED